MSDPKRLTAIEDLVSEAEHQLGSDYDGVRAGNLVEEAYRRGVEAAPVPPPGGAGAPIRVEFPRPTTVADTGTGLAITVEHPPRVIADLRARVIGRELGASPETCLDVGRAYLASESPLSGKPHPAHTEGRCGACGQDVLLVVAFHLHHGEECRGSECPPAAAPPVPPGEGTRTLERWALQRFLRQMTATLRAATTEEWDRPRLVEALTALLESSIADPAPAPGEDADPCGCVESYPQLIPGRVSHGPWCRRRASTAGELDPEKCDPEVYRRGKSIGVYGSLSRPEAQRLCADLREATGWRWDWNYVGGRVVLRFLREE